MTANSASGSKYYELIPTQQDYIVARSQNWLPSYSVITMDADSFSIETYQITDDGTVETIDEAFTIEKTGAAGASEETEAAASEAPAEETETAAAETEAPAEETETAAAETEAPAEETEAAAE